MKQTNCAQAEECQVREKSRLLGLSRRFSNPGKTLNFGLPALAQMTKNGAGTGRLSYAYIE